jgi:hypothetical protein
MNTIILNVIVAMANRDLPLSNAESKLLPPILVRLRCRRLRHNFGQKFAAQAENFFIFLTEI